MEADSHDHAERRGTPTAPDSLAGLGTAGWVAGLVHDLRTPLQGIIGMTEVVLRGELDVWARSCLSTSLDSARSLEGIVNGLLDLIRLDSGSLQLSEKPFWMEELLAHSVRSVLHRAHEGGVRVELEVDPALEGEFVGDALRIRQCLVNLLGNAVKFAEGGNVLLRAESLGSERVRFSVEDDGIGMDAEQLSRVFRPFEQATERTSTRFGGSGMGLTITRSLVELMGGQVRAESVEGAGSRFTIELPLVASTLDEPLPVLDASLERALLTMSDGPGRRLVQRCLAAHGIECQVVDDLESLRDAAESDSWPPQLVIVDHNWLESSPGRLTKLVNRHEPQPTVVVVGRADVGADFRLDLVDHAIVHPITRREFDQVLEQSSISAERRSSDRRDLAVLIADDSSIARRVLEAMLGQLGVACVQATDGTTALDMALRRAETERPFDLLILDQQMPGLDGDQVAGAVREREQAHAAPPCWVAALSGLSDSDERLGGLACFDSVLQKPVTLQGLARLLDRAMERRLRRLRAA